MLMSLAQSPVGRQVIGWIFENMSFAIPVNRLRDTETLIAFYHPKPSYPVHILLVPKKALSDLSDLGEADAPFLGDLFKTVQSLVDEFDLEKVGYRLIVNGGSFQEVPQLHFHLISENL